MNATKKNRGIWIALGILVIAAGVFGWLRSRGETVVYRETKVKKGDIQISILSTGTVQPENRLEIKAPIAGRVDQVLVTEGQKIRKGQILAWMSSTERAAMLDAAGAKGEGEVKRWEEMYKPTPILAPISGMLILRNIESGQTFATTDAILVMSDRLTVKAQVDETDLAQIKLKGTAEIMLDAYPREHIPAKVDQIAFEAKTVSNVTTYIVDVLPDAPPEFMRSGMTANVNFAVDSREGVLVLPTEAIRGAEGKASVLVKGADGQPREQAIETGLSDGKRTEIVSGLKEDDIVLTVQASAKGRQAKATNPFMPSRPGANNNRGRAGGGGGPPP